jgi:regulator of cell morphogenesis and NO signaling
MDMKITEKSTVGDIVKTYPQVQMLFEQLSIDYCCGGKQTLKEACQKAGLSLQNVIEKIEEKLQQSSMESEPTKDWTKASLTELASHIIDTHHAYLREQFPRLKSLADKVYNAHKENHGERIRKLKEVLENLRTDIEMHLDKEEQILFPLIKEMESFSAGQSSKPTVHCGTVENPIRQMEFEHNNAGDMLQQMRNISDDYKLPEDACESFKALYDGLQELENDLHKHIHLENNILFPKSVELESKLDF